MMKPKKNPMLRIYLLTLLQYVVPVVGLALTGLIVSLFFTGLRAEYTRTVSLSGFLVMLAVGILRVGWVFIVSRLNRNE